MEFIAIDVETANADMASICQIGIAKFKNGQLIEEWETLLNPEDYFDPMNISIHGICEVDVNESPVLPDVEQQLLSYMQNTVCVCHTHFDRLAVIQAFSKYGLSHLETTWLDSARVARRAWPEFAQRGYGLANVSAKIGYKFKHHNALEDAKASGQIILAACNKTSLDIDGLLLRIKQPLDPLASSVGNAVKREGNPEGKLYGEVIVFTGALEVSRREAADLASSVGCEVGAGVTTNTTMLVVGDQDISKLAAGKSKSSKHLKAEGLIKKGQELRILKESDFKELVGMN